MAAETPTAFNPCAFCSAVVERLWLAERRDDIRREIDLIRSQERQRVRELLEKAVAKAEFPSHILAESAKTAWEIGMGEAQRLLATLDSLEDGDE